MFLYRALVQVFQEWHEFLHVDYVSYANIAHVRLEGPAQVINTPR